MSSLLARFAESTFWMARYIERVENLARILDVNETFARDGDGSQDWLPIVQLNADEERFFATHDEASARNVVSFYVLDRDNPTSIVSALHMARENARSLRHLISTEMWTHLNIFYNEVQGLGPKSLRLAELSRLCAMIKENCQTHTGISEGTFYRDQAWYFYQIGKALERADQTTRLLEIKYHRLLPAPDAVGSPLDVSQWNALLRSVAGYHAFRRVYPHGLRPSDVADFLLFDEGFPRSLAVSLGQADEPLGVLESRYGLPFSRAARRALDDLRARLTASSIDATVAGGLHEFLDQVQVGLIAVTDGMGEAYFSRGG